MALTFTSIVPSDGAKLALRGAMTFTLSTDLPSAEGVMVSVYCSALDTEEMAWDGAQFVGRYVTASTKVGDDFILYRRGGWPTGGVSLRVRELGALSFMSVFTDGSGVPSNGVGSDGDYYIDTASGSIYKKAAGTYSVISTQLTALTGDVTASGAGSQAATIAAGAVSLAKMANLATDRLIGRSTAGTGVPEAITCTAAGRALLDDADASAQRTTLGLGSLATLSAVADGAITYPKTDRLLTVQSAINTLADSSAVQNIFAAAQDTVTLAANTTYYMRGRLYMNRTSSYANNANTALLFGGTAVISGIAYHTFASATSVADGSPSSGTTTHTNFVSVATAVNVFTAVISPSNHRRDLFFEGFVRITTGGTFIPQIQFSAALGGTTDLRIGSFLELVPVGSDTFVQQGGWS